MSRWLTSGWSSPWPSPSLKLASTPTRRAWRRLWVKVGWDYLPLLLKYLRPQWFLPRVWKYFDSPQFILLYQWYSVWTLPSGSQRKRGFHLSSPTADKSRHSSDNFSFHNFLILMLTFSQCSLARLALCRLFLDAILPISATGVQIFQYHTKKVSLIEKAASHLAYCFYCIA